MIMAIVLTTNGVYVNASEVDHTEELATLEQLISEGTSLPGSNNSTEIFTWVMNVKKYADSPF